MAEVEREWPPRRSAHARPLVDERRGVVAVLAVAFLLRLAGLSSQSLWYDEGLTAWYAGQSIPELASRLVGDEHPPLYFALLHLWLGFAGGGDFSLRFVSAAFGLVGVAATWVLTARLAGPRAGLVAAGLLAVSPFHVWYSQEVRSYTALLALGALTLWALARSLAPGRRRRHLAGLAALNALGLWTHLQFALVGVVEALVVVVWAATLGGYEPIRVRCRRGLAATAAMTVGAATFLPWVPNLLSVLGESDTYWSGRLEPGELLRQTAVAWTVGDRLAALPVALPAPAPLLTTVVLAAAFIGGVRLSLAGRVRSTVVLLAYLVAPCVVLALLVLDRPKFVPRYLLLALPGLFGLIGAGVAAPLPARQTVARTASAGLAALAAAAALSLVLTSAVGLRAQATDQRLWREDYRAAATYLARVASPDDAILLVSGYAQVAFGHYYRGSAPVFPVPDETVPHLRRALDWRGLDVLNRATDGRRRVWVVDWQPEVLDPGGLVHQQLALAGRRVDPGAAFHGLDLTRYDLDGTPHFPIDFAPAEPLGHRFGDGLELVGFDLEPGHWAFKLTLYWRVTVPPGRDLTGFVHLLSPLEHLYGGRDRPPINSVYTTARWRVGDLLRDEYELPVARNAPPGVYRIETGLYDPSSGARVAITAPDGTAVGDRLVIDEVSIGREHVERPPEPPNEFDPPLPSAAGVGLIGWERSTADPRADGELTAVLYWYTGAQTAGLYRTGLALRDGTGGLIADASGPPADGLFPSTAWRPGDTVRDARTLPLPGIVAGSYRLAAVMEDGQGGRCEIDLGDVTVR